MTYNSLVSRPVRKTRRNGLLFAHALNFPDIPGTPDNSVLPPCAVTCGEWYRSLSVRPEFCSVVCFPATGKQRRPNSKRKICETVIQENLAANGIWQIIKFVSP